LLGKELQKCFLLYQSKQTAYICSMQLILEVILMWIIEDRQKVFLKKDSLKPIINCLVYNEEVICLMDKESIHYCNFFLRQLYYFY